MNNWLESNALGGDAPVRLYCFPYAGGGAHVFRSWCRPLLPYVQVCPVLLPGRESRFREQPCDAIGQVVGPLVDALERHADRPFALFGHSMGAAIAYEVAQGLRSDPYRTPSCIFVSGRRAPGLASRYPPIFNLPDQDFIGAIRKLNGTPPDVLTNPELVELLLPMWRADFKLSETHVPRPAEPLETPVSALGGADDPSVQLEELEAWRRFTSKAFKVRLFEGDHFYMNRARDGLLAAIRDDLQELLGG